MGSLFSTPDWRVFEDGGKWDPSYEKELRRQIQQRDKRHGVEYPRVLLLGKAQAGKSSFINSSSTIDKNKLANPVVAEPAKEHVTRKLTPIYLKEKLKLLLLDTKGLADVRGFLDDDIECLIKGHIHFDYEFDEKIKITDKKTDYFKSKPSLEDRIHCAVFVADAKLVDNGSYSKDFMTRVCKLKDYLRKQNINTVLLLTKVDQVDKLHKDIKRVHNSDAIRKIVIKAQKDFEIAEMNIFPVWNYSRELGMDSNMNILLLLALRRIASLADDCITAYKDRVS